MNIKPILFSAPMIRAILREIEAPGTGKTQTRRIAQPQPEWIASSGRWKWAIPKAKQGGCDSVVTASREWHEYLLPHQLPYQAGALLWVREAWRTEGRVDDKAPSKLEPHRWWLHYEADDPAPAGWGRLRPSIHMPRWASRTTLRVTGVRCERLQDISAIDVEAEGLAQISKDDQGWNWQDWSADHRVAYSRLWNSINGPNAWDRNPWVWAITFRPIAGNVDQIKEAS